MLVYPVLPVSVDCPFLIAPSVFFNIYENNKWHTLNTINKAMHFCVNYYCENISRVFAEIITFIYYTL